MLPYLPVRHTWPDELHNGPFLFGQVGQPIRLPGGCP
jgi:hypothetical protein